MRKKLFTCFLAGAMAVAMCIPVMASTATTKQSSEISIIKNDNDGVDVDLPDNETLYEGYISQLFGLSDNQLNTYESIVPEDVLDEFNLNVYYSLKSMIALVAAGTRESTTFTIHLTSGGTIEANSIICSLIANCPYELYWYNRTWTEESTDSHGYKMDVDDNNNLIVQFPVSNAYAGSEDFTTDTSKTSVPIKALENAKNIVKTYAGESDYEKLNAYKNEILNLVSYNEEAVSEDYTGGYGDPWQLVYVFDGDSETNVVCEGYAKAFQYLCDQTNFSSSSIKCHSIHGLIAGTTYNEDGSIDSKDSLSGHMWNIVTMEDGYNYIADLTNCDEDMVGENDKLFLAGATGSYANGYTCYINPDNSKYSYSMYYSYFKTNGTFYSGITQLLTKDQLTLFHADYSNEACKNAIKNGNTYVKDAAKATCGEDGYTGDTYCGACDKIAAYGSVIPATEDHSVKAVVTKATTTKAGSIKYICSVCDTITKTTAIAYPKKYTLSASSYAYDGKEKKPTLKIYDSNNKLISSANYTITYPSGRKKVGTYTYKITFKGNYSGTKSVSFTIVPKKAALKKVIVGTKSMVVYAKAKASAFAGAGYQIAYKATGSSKWIFTTTTKTSKKISKLAKGKKYQIMIRAYKKVGNKTYYGAWSKAIKSKAVK